MQDTATQANGLLKAEEVAKILNVSKGRVYQLTRDGEFREFHVQLGSNQYRWTREGLDRYIATGGKRSSTEAMAA